MSQVTSPNKRGGNGGGGGGGPCSPGSVLGAALSLAVTTMGAGILTLPAAYANAAIFPATLLLLFVAYLTVVSVDFIVLSVEKLGLNSYEEITKKLLGSFYLELVRWMLVFYNVGSAIGYLVVLSDLFEPLLFYFNASPIPIVRDTFQTSKHILFFVWLFIILPVTCVPSLGALHATSFLAISSTCFISFLIVFRYFVPGPDQLGVTTIPTPATTKTGNNNNNNNNIGAVGGSGVRYWQGLHPLLALPIIMFSFDCQSLVFQVYASLDQMCRKTMKEVAVFSILVSGTIHAAVGLFGYLSSPLQVRENVISNYNPRTDVLFFVGYCFYAIPIMLAYVLVLFPIRDSIFILWYGYSSASIATHVPDFTHLVEIEEELNKKLDAAEDEKKQLVHLRIREQFMVSTSSSTTASGSASENGCDINDEDGLRNDPYHAHDDGHHGLRGEAGAAATDMSHTIVHANGTTNYYNNSNSNSNSHSHNTTNMEGAHYGPLHVDEAMSVAKRSNTDIHYNHQKESNNKSEAPSQSGQPHKADVLTTSFANSKQNTLQARRKHRYPPRPDDSRYYTAATNIGDALTTVLQSANNSFFFHPLQTFGRSPPTAPPSTSPQLMSTSVTSRSTPKPQLLKSNKGSSKKASSHHQQQQQQKMSAPFSLGTVEHYHEDSEEEEEEDAASTALPGSHNHHHKLITVYNEKQEDSVDALLLQLRQQLLRLHKQKKENTKKIETITAKDHILVTMSINIISIIGAMLLPGIVSVVAFLGGLCSSSLCFIFPALYRWQLHKQGYAPFILQTRNQIAQGKLDAVLALKLKEEGNERVESRSKKDTFNNNNNNNNNKNEATPLLGRALSAPPKSIAVTNTATNINNNNNNNNNNSNNISAASSLHVANYNSTGVSTKFHFNKSNSSTPPAEEEYKNNIKKKYGVQGGDEENDEEEEEEETNKMEYILTIVMFFFGLGGGLLGTAVAVKVYFFS